MVNQESIMLKGAKLYLHLLARGGLVHAVQWDASLASPLPLSHISIRISTIIRLARSQSNLKTVRHFHSRQHLETCTWLNMYCVSIQTQDACLISVFDTSSVLIIFDYCSWLKTCGSKIGISSKHKQDVQFHDFMVSNLSIKYNMTQCDLGMSTLEIDMSALHGNLFLASPALLLARNPQVKPRSHSWAFHRKTSEWKL